jgi:hypothetical protein
MMQKMKWYCDHDAACGGALIMNVMPELLCLIYITHVNTSYEAEDEMVIVIMMLRVEAR